MISAGRAVDATGSDGLMLMTKTETAGALMLMEFWHFGQGAPRPLGVVVFRTRPPARQKLLALPIQAETARANSSRQHVERDSLNGRYGTYWPTAYCSLILAARITLPHFSVSVASSLS